MLMRANLGWTEDRIELLKKLWHEGLSCSQIASEIGGITRNAVIGKVHRLGLSGRAAVNRKSKDKLQSWRPKHRKMTALARVKKLNLTRIQAAIDDSDPGHVELPPDTPAVNPVGLLDLNPGHCRYPYGEPLSDDFHFCGGQAVKGHSYCLHHCKLAYQPPRERKREAA